MANPNAKEDAEDLPFLTGQEGIELRAFDGGGAVSSYQNIVHGHHDPHHHHQQHQQQQHYHDAHSYSNYNANASSSSLSALCKQWYRFIFALVIIAALHHHNRSDPTTKPATESDTVDADADGTNKFETYYYRDESRTVNKKKKTRAPPDDATRHSAWGKGKGESNNKSIPTVDAVDNDGDDDDGNDDDEKSCIYRLHAFDKLGKPLAMDDFDEGGGGGCVKSENQLLHFLDELAEYNSIVSGNAGSIYYGSASHDTVVDAIVIRSTKNENENVEHEGQVVQQLDRIGGIVDQFLAPRFEWRIVAERFVEDLNNNDEGSDKNESVQRKRSAELLYDPAIFAPTEEEEGDDEDEGGIAVSFAAPAAVARREYLQSLNVNDAAEVTTNVAEKANVYTKRDKRTFHKKAAAAAVAEKANTKRDKRIFHNGNKQNKQVENRFRLLTKKDDAADVSAAARNAIFKRDKRIFHNKDDENNINRSKLVESRAKGKEMLNANGVNKNNKNSGELVEGSSRAREEEMLNANGVDFILVRVRDEKLAAIADALRRYQFPEDCDELDERSQGRTFITYAGGKDSIGALTSNNVKSMEFALIQKGAPYVNAAPPVWARTYQFEDCTNANGMECAFLPSYGGQCLKARVEPSLECLSRFKMGYNQSNIALPKNGIPLNVCAASHHELPALLPSALFSMDTYDYGSGPPKAYAEYCPTCDNASGKEARMPMPRNVANATLPMSIKAFKKFHGTIVNYVHRNSSATKCAMKLSPAQCNAADCDCCADSIFIPQNILLESSDSDQKNANVPQRMLDSAFSSFLTRFNRMSRRRIARLYQPRMKAMNARNVGWEEALSAGNCATLHIHRGDIIDRCNNGEESFCNMKLTLADYMSKATPMLKQLDDAKHVFVMTDDPDVVSEDKLQPWQDDGYFIEVISGFNQYNSSAYEDWDPFIESLHAGKHCRAVVGRSISTASKLVYNSICTRFGECPLVDIME